MAKTQEELNELKQEYESLVTKLKELTEDELGIVTGGSEGTCKPLCTWVSEEINGKPYTKKALVCSDFSLRGTKPECANCPAKNGVN